MTWNGRLERRQHHRAAIRIKSEFGDPNATTRIETIDFSAGGFSCLMDRPIEPLTRLALRFDFPPFGELETRSVVADAVVVRCEQRAPSGPDYVMAAAFTGMAQEDREFLAQFVEWHERVMMPSETDEEEPVAPEGSPGAEG
jgi:hypothetical protein